jgi:hypothetical protein
MALRKYERFDASIDSEAPGWATGWRGMLKGIAGSSSSPGPSGDLSLSKSVRYNLLDFTSSRSLNIHITESGSDPEQERPAR